MEPHSPSPPTPLPTTASGEGRFVPSARADGNWHGTRFTGLQNRCITNNACAALTRGGSSRLRPCDPRLMRALLCCLSYRTDALPAELTPRKTPVIAGETPAIQELPLDAKHLLQSRYDFHQVRLRGHDSVDVFVGSGDLVDHTAILAALHAVGLACKVFQPERALGGAA